MEKRERNFFDNWDSIAYDWKLAGSYNGEGEYEKM